MFTIKILSLRKCFFFLNIIYIQDNFLLLRNLENDPKMSSSFIMCNEKRGLPNLFLTCAASNLSAAILYDFFHRSLSSKICIFFFFGDYNFCYIQRLFGWSEPEGIRNCRALWSGKERNSLRIQWRYKSNME